MLDFRKEISELLEATGVLRAAANNLNSRYDGTAASLELASQDLLVIRDLARKVTTKVTDCTRAIDQSKG